VSLLRLISRIMNLRNYDALWTSKMLTLVCNLTWGGGQYQESMLQASSRVSNTYLKIRAIWQRRPVVRDLVLVHRGSSCAGEIAMRF
jgi:hypothetical protein